MQCYKHRQAITKMRISAHKQYQFYNMNNMPEIFNNFFKTNNEIHHHNTTSSKKLHKSYTN